MTDRDPSTGPAGPTGSAEPPASAEPPPSAEPTGPATSGRGDDGHLWHVAGVSAAAIEAARAAARRAGVPLGAWLAGLIRHVAALERTADRRTTRSDTDETDPR